MPLKQFDNWRNVDWNRKQLDWQDACVLLRQSRSDRRDTLGADDQLRNEIKIRNKHFDSALVIEASQYALIVVEGTYLLAMDKHVSELKVFVKGYRRSDLSILFPRDAAVRVFKQCFSGM